MVLKTTFGQSQGWSLIRGTLCVENGEKNNFNFRNKVFNEQDILILGGLNSGILLYLIKSILSGIYMQPTERFQNKVNHRTTLRLE